MIDKFEPNLAENYIWIHLLLQMVHVCPFVCFALFYFLLILICFAWFFWVLFIGFYLLVIVMLCFVYIFFIVIFCRRGEGGGYRGTYYFWDKPADMPMNNIVLI